MAGYGRLSKWQEGLSCTQKLKSWSPVRPSSRAPNPNQVQKLLTVKSNHCVWDRKVVDVSSLKHTLTCEPVKNSNSWL